jgi:hypothetical protein
VLGTAFINDSNYLNHRLPTQGMVQLTLEHSFVTREASGTFISQQISIKNVHQRGGKTPQPNVGKSGPLTEAALYKNLYTFSGTVNSDPTIVRLTAADMP